MPLLVGAALASVAVAAPSATGTEGSLYTYGSETVSGHIWDSQFTATGFANYGIIGYPANPALTGEKWRIDLTAPVPGSAVETIRWSARRDQAPSSLEIQVLADGPAVWRVADQDMAASPAPPKPYLVGGLRAQTVSLRFFQVEQRAQGPRSYTIYAPGIQVRDLDSPTSSTPGVPGGWIRASTAQTNWIAADNFGSDGLAQQRIIVSGQVKYAGAPGQGAHQATIDVGSLGDGAHNLRLEVDGDGTGGATPKDAVINIDRTPPEAAVAARKTARDRADLSLHIADATSGVASWEVRAQGPDGQVVANSAGTGPHTGIDLSRFVPPGGDVRFFLSVRDRAGNAAQAVSAPVRHDPPPVPSSGGDATPMREPGSLPSPEALAPGVALPDFSRITIAGLGSPQARRYLITGGQRIPIVRARYARRAVISGRFRHPNGSGLRGATVYLFDPAGRPRGRTLTTRTGRFVFVFRPRIHGTWQVGALGRPLVTARAAVAVAPLVGTRQNRTIASGQRLVIRGTVIPRRLAFEKLVILQWQDGTRWRPIDTARVGRTGAFRFSYRFRWASGTIRMRVTVPGEQGWPFAGTASRPVGIRVQS